ncbi:hypothetical protein D9O36_04555 [Zobellia amurskyensis]|uniref:Uncharacterized protein n=1 Tax=Zobellia amurskyensis TaxID=248905 RepID=A0A7X3D138_9FLAO|nr:DUF5687 family protein [Zobellia amurskyensis]MUH35103.1 hypothetical protein [Zobellia amurskyensis]
MFKSFSKLQWKSFFRSSSMGKSLGVKIVMGFLALYLMGMLAFFGSALFFILERAIPDTDPLIVVSQFLLYWILAELFLRYFMQKLPVMDVKPFLVLPIKKSSIAHYILGRSAISFYNFLALFFFVPFGVVLLIKGYALLNVLFWLLAMIGIVLSINYINFIVNKSDKALVGIGVLLLAFYGLDYFQVLPIKQYGGNIFYALYENPFYAILPLVVAGVSYYINYSFIRNRIFLDASLKKKTAEATSSDLSWIKRFGAIAPFLQLDLKLIWRNKRTKTQVFMSLAFGFYGLIFYTMEDFGMGSGMLVFVGIFMTGIFLMNFGQFIPAWDSSYYSMMMSQNIPLRKYLEAKAALIYVSIGVMFLLSVPYVYFGWEALAINFSCALYNLGVNVPVILFFGSKNKKRIDLNKSALGNMQGTSATQFIVGIPLFGIPLLIYGVIAFFVSFEVALITLCVLGIIGFAFRNRLLDQITSAYRKKKYGMIAGFKEQNG